MIADSELAGIVLCGSVQATLFVSHLQNIIVRVHRIFFSTHTEKTATNRGEILAEFDKKRIGSKSITAPLITSEFMHN